MGALDDLMGDPRYSENIEDRRGDDRSFNLERLLGDLWRNNAVARYFRNGKYAGPGYDYQPWIRGEADDPMARALGADQIPITTYGTTHPLKRYNPDYNSDSPRLPWNRK